MAYDAQRRHRLIQYLRSGKRRLQACDEDTCLLLEKYGFDDGIHCLIHSDSPESLKEAKSINPYIPCGLIIAMAIGTYYDLDYADFFSVESTFATASVVNAIHTRGKMIFVWTVDDADTIEKMVDRNVDGIIGDDPERIAEVQRKTAFRIDRNLS